MQVKRIISKVYESNTYIIINGEEALIIDGGATSEEIKRGFSVSSAKVVGVLVTHGHFDHSFYLEKYIDRFKCKVYLAREAKETLADPNKNYGDNFSIKAGKNYKCLDGDGEIQISSFNVKYYHTPGHSKCCMTYLIDDKLFSGDTVFKKTIGRTDLYGGSDKEMKESLEKIIKLPFKEVYPGHGNQGTYDDIKRVTDVYIPFLDKHSLKMFLDKKD